MCFQNFYSRREKVFVCKKKLPTFRQIVINSVVDWVKALKFFSDIFSDKWSQTYATTEIKALEFFFRHFYQHFLGGLGG